VLALNLTAQPASVTNLEGFVAILIATTRWRPKGVRGYGWAPYDQGDGPVL